MKKKIIFCLAVFITIIIIISLYGIYRIESLIEEASLLSAKKRFSLMNMENNKRILFLVLIAVPALFLVICMIMINSIPKPLYAFLDSLRLFQSGNLNLPERRLWKDEFSEAASTVNELLLNLNAQMGRMQRTEQLALFGQLATGLVHEVKNPLAGIKADLELFSVGLPSPKEIRRL